MRDYTTLQVVWFVLITVLWIGYFVLEGFDFGVGMLMRAVGRTEAQERQVLHAIGPVWDGNEVWLLVAGGATFAAFPMWYSTLFSGFYLALFLILIALIVRGVVFEFWGKGHSEGWRNAWSWAMVLSSGLVALLWGVAWANIVHGVPIDAQQNYTGDLLTLLNPYALLGGLVTLTVFLLHGAIFLSLRVSGEMQERAERIARGAWPVALVLGAVFLVWTVVDRTGGVAPVSAAAAAVCALLLIGVGPMLRRNARNAFFLNAGAILFFVVALVTSLFPYVMRSTTNVAYSMTLNESASSHYTLQVMTWVAVFLVPVVLLYQGWAYWVFRHRLDPDDYAEPPSPAKLVADARESLAE